MNWLQKTASVTFSLEQSDRIAQPKTISSIANAFFTWALKHVPRNLIGSGSRRLIDMDGVNVSSPTGTINWYVKNADLAADIPMYVNQWVQEEMLPLGFHVRLGNLEPSGMYSMLVYRIHVLNNPTGDYPQIPEINLSNINAEGFLNSLNIPTKYLEGSMSIDEFEQRMLRFTNDPIENPAEGIQRSNPRREEMKQYAQRFQNMIDYARQNGFKKIQWN